MQSCLYEGRVRHRRFAPRGHSFSYRVLYAFLDLDELEEVFNGIPFWSVKKPALAWFRRSDYLGNPSIALKQAVREKIRAVTGKQPAGPIRVLTHLRFFGFNFNPVTFYYCYEPGGRDLETIVAEITNTPWGERHAYVLPVANSRSNRRYVRFKLKKEFHVSPFMSMDMKYDWLFNKPGGRLNIHMINLSNEKMFDATLTLLRKPINAFNCTSALARYPLITCKVVAAIYWQAFKLFLKKIPFYTHPSKLKNNTGGSADTAESL